jgi:hypothetical protein
VLAISVDASVPVTSLQVLTPDAACRVLCVTLLFAACIVTAALAAKLHDAPRGEKVLRAALLHCPCLFHKHVDVAVDVQLNMAALLHDVDSSAGSGSSSSSHNSVGSSSCDDQLLIQISMQWRMSC